MRDSETRYKAVELLVSHLTLSLAPVDWYDHLPFDMDSNESMAAQNLTQPYEGCTIELPTVQEYLEGINYPLALIVVATVLLSIATFSIFFKNAYHILHRTPKQFKTKSILLLTIYPLVTLFGVVSISAPRAYFLCDTVMHVYFMICAYVFFSLCMQYVDGEDALIKSTDSQTFSLRTPPLCCFVPLFKRAPVTKNRLRFVRMLIMQLPVVQTALFLALNVVFVEDYPNFNRIILYFVPFIVISILLGVWGLNVLVRMLAPLYSDLKLMGKYFVLQAVLILCRIQPLIIAAIVSSTVSECAFPITLQVQKNAIFQLCLCFEMMVLSCWATLLYKSPSIIGQG
uniref:Organic solute transporter alpha-like protein n=1 Tax=Anopheles farauti TaxID=69004 RepID=A0A182QJU1_9DIPT